MRKRFGFDLLAEQAAECAAARIDAEASYFESRGDGDGCGDSPIERLLYAAVQMYCSYGDLLVAWNIYRPNAEEELDPRRHGDKLIFRQQVEISEIGRVDFLFMAYGHWIRSEGEGIPGWRRLIVECDGHDFHERTKEQAAKDRSRDRAAVAAAYDVFRFTGSELWRDPWGCAKQVFDWVERGL